MNVHHLKTRYSGLTNKPFADVEIGPAFAPTDPPPVIKRFRGLWDTGASGSVITQDVVDSLQLKQLTVTTVQHAAGTTLAEVYLISLKFPNSIGFRSIRVTKGILGKDLSVLIGMDVILNGDFSITNHDGATEINFQVPSRGLRELCKVQEKLKIPSTAPIPATASPQPSFPRNAPCPCGSGKKFKQCHGGSNPPQTQLPTMGKSK